MFDAEYPQRGAVFGRISAQIIDRALLVAEIGEVNIDSDCSMQHWLVGVVTGCAKFSRGEKICPVHLNREQAGASLYDCFACIQGRKITL